MARESRRRSQDDSKRRRRDRDRDREQRRSSRDRQYVAQPTNTNAYYPQNPSTGSYPIPDGTRRRDDRRRSYSSTSSSSSSVASSLLDISRSYTPTKRYGGFIGTFFRAPSERRRRSRRTTARSSKRPNFYFGGGNSSSSSVNSDLAYGQGYIPRLHGRNGSSRNVAGDGRHRSTRNRDGYESASRPGGPARSKTDEEILSIGRQLNELARDQNKKDLKASGIAKPTAMAAGAAALYAMHKRKKRNSSPGSRGIGSSKPHGASSDDEDWESASDDDGDDSDDANSHLAYGSAVGSHVGPGFGTAAGAVAGAAGAAYVGHELYDKYGRRKSSVVDPALFGPVNSLHGMINTPCGFDDPRNKRPTNDQRYNSGASYDNAAPMRDVYPVPTSDPNRFDADRVSSTALPHRSRPSAVPLQQPVPKVPVSSKVYNAEKLEDSSRRDSRDGRDRSDSHGISASTAAGLTAAALGAAALTSKKDKHSSRDYDDRDRERERERERDRDRDSKRRDKDSDRDGERRKSKRDSQGSKYGDDHKRHSRYDDYDETPRKRREVEAGEYHERSSKSRGDKDRRDRDYDRDSKSEVSRSSRRDSDKYSKRGDRYEESKKSKVGDKDSAEVPKSISSSKIDPFQFQVADDAFITPPISNIKRPLTPNIVTIDYEPDFSDNEVLSFPDSRLSRKDSFEIEQMSEDHASGSKEIRRKDPRSGHDYEEGEHAASSIYDEAKHATIPVAAGAIVAAIAVESQRSRERRRDQYDDYGSRDHSAEKRDAVQEEADRYYRESVIARKIEEEHNRGDVPEKSVVTKWDDDEKDTVTIVTPPEMDDRHKDVGPYDAPNADVRIDNHIYPDDEDQYKIKTGKKGKKKAKQFKSRDPSCERERPLLNLVLPTPLPSREPTPAVEQQVSRQVDAGETTSRDVDATPDVVIGPRGEVMQNSAANKSVTWGENSTKSFVVESPDPESRSDVDYEKTETATRDSSSGSPPGKDKTRSRLANTSQWGILAAAIAGSSKEPDNEPETVTKSSKKSKKSKSSPTDADFSAMGPDQVFSADTRDQPPIPGPKPASPSTDKMPGSYADDIEFAATLAAGLKDTGFDSNIVIDDPTYRRRDSPPGSKEANGDDWRHQSSFSDIVTDATSKKAYERSVASEPGSKSRDLESPRDKTSQGDEWPDSSKTLSKKEKKKLEKLRRQSTDSVEPSETASPDSVSFEDAVESLPKLSKKEQKKRDKEARARALQLESEEFADTQHNEPEADTPTTREASEDIWEDSSSKKKKKKNRKSRDLEDDRVSVPTDAFDDLQSLRKTDKNDEDDWDTPSKSKRKSMTDFEALSKAATGSEISETPSKKSSKSSKRRSLNEETLKQYNDDDELPSDRRREFFDDREVTSVVSESRGDDRRRDSKSKRSSRYDDDDDTKSIASAPGGSRKSRDKDKDKDSSKRSSGLFASIFKGKEDDKKDSFLDNAGTLGAGVGLAGAAAVVASSISRSNAAKRSHESDRDVDDDDFSRRSEYEALDPEIAPRAIKPAIDPQYGDLLPLPPSEPGSPRQGPEELPALPDSRPDTPPEERNLRREQMTHRRRRSTQDAQTKSPSNTAIPISLRLGQRVSPASPSNNNTSMRSPPMSSPSPTTTPEALAKRVARGTSWDSSREIKPLYLLEHSRHGSNEAVIKQEDLPELPPSEPSEPPSREEPNPDYGAVDETDRELSRDDLATTGLHIQTDMSKSLDHLAGSQETTPKAEFKPVFPTAAEVVDIDDKEPDPIDATSKDRSSYLLNTTPSSTRTADGDSFQSPLGSTPSKQHSNELLPEILEDLTSADEHFSDALEAHSRRGSEDSASGAQTLPETTVAEPVAEETTRDAAAAEPDEWFGLTAKQKKKLKKARKSGTSLDLLDATEGSEAVPTEDAEQSKELPAEETTPTLDDFETPKKGKKSKKNKKRQSFDPWDEPAPSSDLVDTVTDDAPVDAEPESKVEDVPVAAVEQEQDTAEVQVEDAWAASLSKKDKKKQKKKLELERQLALADPVEETPAPETEAEPVTEATAEVTESRDLPQEAAPEEDFDFAPVTSKGKKKKKEKRKSVQWDEPEEPAPAPVVEEAADSHKEADTYYPSSVGLHSTHSQSPQDNSDTSYFPSASRVLPAVAAAAAGGYLLKETLADDESTEHKTGDEQSKSIDGPASLEQHVSEPLFSQDAPLAETQDGITSVEPTQLEDAAVPEPADKWAEIPSKKSKKDKKKKKSQSNVWDLIEGTSTDPAGDSAQADTTEDALTTALDRGLTEEPAPVESATAQADDEWSLPTSGKKSKKDKKKKRESVTFADEPEVAEPVQDVTLERSMADEPVEAEMPRESTAEPANVDEWPVTLSKKDKKKKRQSLLSNPEQDNNEVDQFTSPLPDEPTVSEAVQDAAVNPDDEFELPKKGKKGKKGKKSSVVLDWAADEPAAEAAEPVEDDVKVEGDQPAKEEETRDISLDDDLPKATEPSRDDIVVEVEPETPNDASNDADFFPVKMSKKDKKKKKKKALEAEWDSQPEPSDVPVEVQDVLADINASAPTGEDVETAADPEPAVEKGLDEQADDDSFGFGLSKKEKKKLKKKGLLVDDDISAPPVDVQEEPVVADAEPATEKAQDEPVADDNSFGFGLSKKEKKKLKKKGLLVEDVPEVKEEPVSVPEDDAEPTDEKAQDDPVADDDSFGFGLSKKEKKKLKKKGLLVEDVDVQDEPAAIADDFEPPAETVQDDMVADDSFGFGLSKKEKKKLKKKGLLVDDVVDTQDEPAAIADDIEPAAKTVQDDPAADDSFGFGLSKKELKKLKKKGLLADDVVDTPDEPATEKGQDEPAAADDSFGFGLSKKELKKLKKKGLLPDETAVLPSADTDAVADAKEDDLPAALEPEPVEQEQDVVATDDSWDVGLSKKEKKKLKKKGLLVDDPIESKDDPTSVPVDDAPAVEIADEMQPAAQDDQGGDDSFGFGLSKKEKKKLKKKGLLADDPIESKEEPASIPEDDMPTIDAAAGDAVDPATEAAQDDLAAEDSFGFGLSKKEKKKLKKKGLLADDPIDVKEDSSHAFDDQPVADAEPVAETAQDDLADDDSFGFGLSKKDKKKLKKKGLAAAAIAGAAGLALNTADNDDESDKARDDDLSASASPTREIIDSPVAAVEDNDDPFPFTMSKKDKKKAKKLAKEAKNALGDQDIDNEPAVPESSRDESPTTPVSSSWADEMNDDDVAPAAEQFPDKSAASSDKEQDSTDADFGFETSSSKKKSKKDKKKRKSGLQTFELPGEDASAEAPESGELQRDLEQDAPLADADVQAAEVNDDDAWGVPVKKGKKGKKSKRSSIVDAPMPEAEPEPVTEDFKSSAELESTARVAEDPIVEDNIVEPEQRDLADELKAEPADDDFWPVTKKSGKKSKKNKSISISLADEPEQIADREFNDKEHVDTVDTFTDSAEPPAPAPPAEDDWDLPKKKKGKGKKNKSISLAEDDSWPSSTAPENGNAFDESTTVQPVEAAVDDEWDTPSSKKKSKKDKKRQSTQDKLELDVSEKQSSSKDLWDDEEFFAPKSKSPVDDFMQERSQDALEARPVMTSSPTAMTSMEDVVKHTMDKQSAVVGDLPTSSMGDIVEQAMSKDVPTHDHPASSMEDIVGQVMDKKSQAEEEPVEWGTTKKSKKKNRKSVSDDAEVSVENAAAAAALTGGVAMLAEKFGGGSGKKGKKSKNKKIVDKRSSRDDDIFDDPALWESADKKNVTEEADAEADDFWQTSRGDEEDGGRERGLGDSEFSRSVPEPASLLRQDSNNRETGHLLQEQPWSPNSELSELRSSPTRGLPAVPEIPEAEADPTSGSHWPTPELNRDSGFMASSPRIGSSRRSPRLEDVAHRDSGVHSGEWSDSVGHEASTETRRLRHSPSGTPVLKEPSSTSRGMDDPEKRIGPASKNYGGIVAGAAGLSTAAAAAASMRGGSKKHYNDNGSDVGRRSVSDSVYSPNKASFSERDPQGRADAVSGLGGVAGARRSVSNSSLSRQRTPEPLKFRPDSPGIRGSATPTPPLRRVDKRLSGDLRALRQQNNSTPPVANEGRVRSKDMADVYDGFGEGRLGSPKSPTRPHSMRRRQSMQVLDLEAKVEQLMAENRMLSEARSNEDRGGRSVSVLSERDAEIDTLKQSIQYLQQEVARLSEVNDGLTSANAELASKDGGRLGGVYMHSGDGTRGLDGGAGSPSFQTLEEKDAEIADLRSQLEAAKEQIRDMQRKILESKAGDAEFLDVQDEDYFDNRCQQLCSHVQQWVLRFSKFSDMRACRLTSEINDEKTIDRLDNAVLDGSDVDTYLNDRVKRRDIFMSMTMNMIWEFVFTRYLFGMDREQRQKLKSLEKLLNEVGPMQAVRQWRAVTLTLLSRRESFKEQRDQDTEAVVQAIFQTLCKILPPPGNLETQIQSQLRRVMNEAVDLAIEMRKQKAEYMMLPPLQPEYDADGELAATVQFNASMMNERSTQNTSSNEDLEAQGSIVRVVLFPLVVKKGDDEGVGDDEIVVCPAQVIIAREHQRRHLTPGSDAGGASLGAPSRLSVVTDAMSGAPDAQYME